MAATDRITMTMREFDRFKVIQSVVDGQLKPWRAAERLLLTTRQVRRLAARLREQGPPGLISGRCAKPSNHRIDAGIALKAVTIIRERYADFGPTLACEKLRECHGLTLAKETVRQLMIEAGMWIPRKQRAPRVHQPRARRACVGELVQIDGSDHHWFEDRAPPCTLLVFVDDATSRLMALHFTATESTFSYFEATRAYLEQHGKPVAFYSDKAAVFHCNHQASAPGKGVTQYGRALYELNIETWCANSSQAKGRVERANLTLQDRLVKELRLREISTREAANAYAPHFVADYNARFGKVPRSAFDAHRPLRADEHLDWILTWRVARKVSKVLTVQYDRVIYLLADTPENRGLINQYIEVVEYPDGRIELWANGAALPYVPYDRISQIDHGMVIEHKRLSHALQVAQQMQALRDDRRAADSPSRTNRGVAAREHHNPLNKKIGRALDETDLNAALIGTAKGWHDAIAKH